MVEMTERRGESSFEVRQLTHHGAVAETMHVNATLTDNVSSNHELGAPVVDVLVSCPGRMGLGITTDNADDLFDAGMVLIKAARALILEQAQRRQLR